MDPPPYLEARAAGLKFYWSGSTCLRGHIAKRRVKSGQCQACYKLVERARKQRRRQDRDWKDRRNEKAAVDRSRPAAKVLGNLRRRYTKVARGYPRAVAARDLLGPVDAAIRHLEQQFAAGMTWDNHGRTSAEWSIDHVRCLREFDLTNPVQAEEAFHYTNLQPLWNPDHQKKDNPKTNP